MQRRCLPAGLTSADMMCLMPIRPCKVVGHNIRGFTSACRSASVSRSCSWQSMTPSEASDACACFHAEDDPSAISTIEQYTAPLPPAGVWGTRTALLPAANDGGDGVSEQQLQAQAWVPSVLAALLSQAERSIGCIISDEDGARHQCPHGPRRTGCGDALTWLVC